MKKTKNAPFVDRLGYALEGIRSSLKTEASFKFQIGAAVAAFAFLGVMRASPMWWALFGLAIAGVLSAELFNTALEHLMDLVHPETHPAIKVAKDCCAGAVLVFSTASLIVLVCFLLTI